MKEGYQDTTLRNDIYLVNHSDGKSMSFNRTTRQMKTFEGMDKKSHFTIAREQKDDEWTVKLTNEGELPIMVDREKVNTNESIKLETFQRICVETEDNIAFLFVDYRPDYKNENPTEINKKYRLKECIGYGYTGNVFYSFSMDRMQPCAMKRVNKHKFAEYEGLDCLDEFDMLNGLTHPNIIELYGFHDTVDYLYLELEYAGGGNLFDKLYDEDYGKVMSEFLSKITMYQMVHAVAYMHRLGVTHRDLKPENMLLMTRDEPCLMKLADFGTSHIGNRTSLMTSSACTVEHAAPEMLKKKLHAQDAKPYNCLVDCWSLGVVIYETLCARQPFYDDSDDEVSIETKIYHGDYQFFDEDWENITPMPRELIKALLETIPSKRMTAEQLLAHEWFQDEKMLSVYAQLTSQWRRGARPLAMFNM